MARSSFDAARRRLLAGGGLGALVGSLLPAPARGAGKGGMLADERFTGMTTVGSVDPAFNGFDPHDILSDWDGGRVSTLPDGQRLREYDIVAGRPCA